MPPVLVFFVRPQDPGGHRGSLFLLSPSQARNLVSERTMRLPCRRSRVEEWNAHMHLHKVRKSLQEQQMLPGAIVDGGRETEIRAKWMHDVSDTV